MKRKLLRKSLLLVSVILMLVGCGTVQKPSDLGENGVNDLTLNEEENAQNETKTKYLLTKVTIYSGDSTNITNIKEYEYDQDGKMIKMTSYDWEGNINLINEYDEYGNVIKSSGNLIGESFEYTCEYEYDQDGIPLSGKGYSNGVCIYEYEFDEQGNLTKTTDFKYDSENPSETENTYDTNGNLLSTTTYYGEHYGEQFYGQRIPIASYEYDEHGIETKTITYFYDSIANEVTSLTTAFQLEYEYDEQGNVIKAMAYMIGEEGNIIFTTREYEYKEN